MIFVLNEVSLQFRSLIYVTPCVELYSADSISFYKDSEQSWRMNQDFGFHAIPSLFVRDQKQRKEKITFPRN